MVNAKSSGPGTYIIQLSQADEYKLRRIADRFNTTVTAVLCKVLEGKWAIDYPHTRGK